MGEKDDEDEIRDQLEHVSEQLQAANRTIQSIARLVGLNAWPDAADFQKRLVAKVEERCRKN